MAAYKQTLQEIAQLRRPPFLVMNWVRQRKPAVMLAELPDGAFLGYWAGKPAEKLRFDGLTSEWVWKTNFLE